jgi:16S rRNA (cytosine1402-N4)-methyltransferase
VKKLLKSFPPPVFNMSSFHIPVLLQSVSTFLQVSPGQRYIDATLGGGGHTLEIIKHGGLVLGFDQDPEALSACLDSDQLIKVQSNFIHLSHEAEKHHWSPVSGILFDLGMSSHQLNLSDRGFSFQKDSPLDMRMDPSLSATAADLLNTLPPADLTRIFREYGQEAQAGSIARRIINSRPLSTTAQLSRLLKSDKERRRIFQALRITVNDELGALKTALPQALTILKPGGKILVISFHSLEDRIVKQQFLFWSKNHLGEILTKSPVIPDEAEINQNPKSKSAKLRVFIKRYA